MSVRTLKCQICGKVSSDTQQRHFCSSYSNRDFDRRDQQYRSVVNPVQTIGKEGHTLRVSYDSQHHAYTLQYRGHDMLVSESLIMWGEYPMNLLANEATKFIKLIDKKVGWDWEPNSGGLGHEQILAKLEPGRKNAS